jgi:hypothetical protein
MYANNLGRFGEKGLMAAFYFWWLAFQKMVRRSEHPVPPILGKK